MLFHFKMCSEATIISVESTITGSVMFPLYVYFMSYTSLCSFIYLFIHTSGFALALWCYYQLDVFVSSVLGL